MNVISIPVVAMAGITLYAGVNQFLIFLHRRQRREDLTFALTCLTAGIYDIFCAYLYSATSLAEGVIYQRAQVVTLALVSAAFLWFIADYTRLASKRVLSGFTIFFLFAAIAGAIDRTALTWNIDKPLIKSFSLGFLGKITYYEATPGLLINIQSAAGIIGLGYIFWCALRLYRSGQEKKARPLLIAMTLFIIGAVNDTAVSIGIYQFIYLIEYAYMGMVVLMASSLSHEIVEAALVKDELENSEKRFRLLAEKIRAIFESISDGITVTDLQGTIVDINEMILKIYGYSHRDEIIGRSAFDFISKDDWEEARVNMEKTLQNGHSGWVEYRLIKEDGSEFDGELLSAVLLKDTDQNPIGFVATTRDISERKRKEREQETIIAVANAMRTAPTLAQLLPIILNQINNLFHTNGSVISLYDTFSDEMVVELGTGIWDWFTGHRIPSSTSINSQVMNTKEVYLTEDIRNEPTFSWSDQLKNPTAVVISPLIVHKEAIGTIWVSREKNFNEEEIRLIGLIRDMAASAIHRSSLHEQTERRLRYLSGLRMIDLAIARSFDLHATLDLLINQVISQLTVDAAAILLLNQTSLTLEFAAGNGFRTEAIREARISLGDSYAGKAAIERKMVHFSSKDTPNHPPQFTSMLKNEGFVEYFGLPLISKGNIKGVLEIFHRTPLQTDPEWLDFMDMLSQQAAIAIDNSELFEDLQHSNLELALAYESTLEGWSHALDMRDKETEDHTQRVVELTLQLANQMGVRDEEFQHIRWGALLHDIGKMAISDDILFKPGSLNEEEMAIMRQHTVFAYKLLSPISYLSQALDIPYNHHERWDGGGYPRGLKGGEIPLAARIFAVVDVWDALRSDRPYRPAWSDEEALEYIRSQSGSHFDPKIVETFLQMAEISD